MSAAILAGAASLILIALAVAEPKTWPIALCGISFWMGYVVGHEGKRCSKCDYEKKCEEDARWRAAMLKDYHVDENDSEKT